MHNKNDRQDNDLKNTTMGNDTRRKPGSGNFGSPAGSNSEMSREEKSPGRGGSGTPGSTGSSEGRH